MSTASPNPGVSTTVSLNLTPPSFISIVEGFTCNNIAIKLFEMQLKVLQKRYKVKNKVTLCALIIIQVLKPVSVENITCYDTLIINVEIKQKPHYSEVKLKIILLYCA